MKKSVLLAFLAVLGLASVNQKAVAADPFDLLPDPATEAELQTGGTFLVLNVKTGKFLTRTLESNNWGTRACVANYFPTNESGLADDSYQFEITHVGNGIYTLYSKGINNQGQQKNGYLFATDASVWTDAGSSDNGKWALTATEGAAFSMKSQSASVNDPLAFFAPQGPVNYELCWSDTQSSTHEEYIHWRFYDVAKSTDFINANAFAKSKLDRVIQKAEKLSAERENAALTVALADAKSASPAAYNAQVNALNTAITAYLSNLVTIYEGAASVTINNPDLTTNFDGWVFGANVVGGAGSGVGEMYQQNDQTMSQVIAGCEPGVYKLVAQAFFRPAGNSLEAIASWADVPSTATMYATVGEITKSVPLPSLYSIPRNTSLSGNSRGFANGTGSANAVFSSGLYPVELDFVVLETGDVTLGIASGPRAGARWLAFDSFRLIRLGELTASATPEQLQTLTALVAEAEALLSQKMLGTASADLTEKRAAARLITASHTVVQAQEAIDDLTRALAAAKTSAEQYAALKTVLDNARTNQVGYQSFSGYEAFVAAVSTAQDLYDAALVADLTEAIAALKSAERTCRLTQLPPADFTFMVANPGFEEGDGRIGWTDPLPGLNTTVLNHFNNRFMEAWVDSRGALSNMNVYQVINDLPAGYYRLSAAVNATRQNNESLAVSGVLLYANDSLVSCHTGNGFPEIFEVPAVYVPEEGSLRIGVKFVGTDANWVAMDNFKLDYLMKVAVEENTLNVTGELSESTVASVNAVLTADITSVDFKDAAVNQPITLTPANPHTIFTSLPAGVTLARGINSQDAGNVTLDEAYSFHSPLAFPATVSYVREFNKNNASSKEDVVSGWQSIALPFAVESITALQGEETIELVPFAAWDQAAQDAGKRPFWLYRVNPTGSSAADAYVSAPSIEANTLYLISMPNDPSYGASYNITGLVTFHGSTIAVTNLVSQNVAVGHTVTPHFGGTKSGVYALNEEGSAWISNSSVGSFQGYASTSDATNPPFLPIFGGNVTGIKEVLSPAIDNRGTVLVTVDNGVLIESMKAGKVAIYNLSGQLVKVASVSEGSNLIVLPSGQYAILGSVVIIK